MKRFLIFAVMAFALLMAMPGVAAEKADSAAIAAADSIRQAELTSTIQDIVRQEMNHYDGNSESVEDILAMMIPQVATLIPLFKMMSKLGFINTVWGFMLPAISTPFLIMMFRQNSRNFPIDIMEAARIDGLSEIGIFFKMYMPVQKSTYAAAAVITFMNAWNSYLWPKVILNKPAAITMPMLIANLAAGYTVDYGVLMMGVLFCSIPTMLVFFVLQKQFAEGITGSVK